MISNIVFSSLAVVGAWFMGLTLGIFIMRQHRRGELHSQQALIEKQRELIDKYDSFVNGLDPRLKVVIESEKTRITH